MKKSLLFRSLTAALLLLVLTACGQNSSSTTETPSVSAKISDVALTQSADAYRPAAATQEAAVSSLKPLDPTVTPTATNVVLGAPLASQTTAAQKSNAGSGEDNMGKPLQIGFGREVAQTSTPAATQQLLKWKTTASGGQVAAINFNSTGAKGIRVGLLVTQLPETATLRFYAKGAATAFEVKGSEVLAVLAKNLAAGDKSDDGRTYWSPVIKANNGTIEIEIPTGVDINAVQVSFPIVTHLFISMNEAQTILTQSTYDATYPYRTGNNSTQTCQVDTTCTTPLPAASDAVAWLVFNQSGGYASICSGTLLNDNINSATPYVLTANHCISTQTFASTLYTEFKYRSLACNNAVTGEYYPTATTGAKLLYTATVTDSTLLNLYGTPSTSVLFAGWDATTAPALNTVVHGIHHPQGDQQRLSRGSVVSYHTASGATSNITSGTFLGVTQTLGTTEPGSSGSSLMKGTDANPQVIGQLLGRFVGTHPEESCADSTEKRIYGRFDVAFNAGMKDWLVQGVRSVTQYFNATTGMTFYTAGVTEGKNFKASNTTFVESTTFKASSIQTAGLSPVYRFYNTSNGSYFYTISEKERAAVASNTPRMRYDGIVWYASATAAASTVPVYSAFNSASGSQFFTTNSTERSNLIASNPQFKTDGIAFYVTP